MKNLKKGFTIIEMVIVIAIIGILASVLIPTYGNVVASANESAAMQTARSVMTNWLASSTSAHGVPTSGKDSHGNDFYAAYFEVPGKDGQTYQYRYSSGGVERTDNDNSKIQNFNGAGYANVDCYLATPLTEKQFDGDTYKVKAYRQLQNGGSETYYNYYIMYPTSANTESAPKYAYDFGGAAVYAASNGAQKVWTVVNGTVKTPGESQVWAANAAGNEVAIYASGEVTNGVAQEGNTPVENSIKYTQVQLDAITAWNESGVYTITAKANEAAGIDADDALTTGTDGKLTSLPTLNTGFKWYDAQTGGNEVTTATVFTANGTIYAHN